jgi:hypothetical protein
MARILKTLLGRRQNEVTPEEIEALDRATNMLQFRVEQMTRRDAAKSGDKAAA